jgi:hypothetical protein
MNGCFRKEFNVNQTVLVVLQPLNKNVTVLLVVMQLKRFGEKQETTYMECTMVCRVVFYIIVGRG